MLRNRIKWNFPAWKNQDGRVALQPMSKNLGPFDTQIDATIFDGRDACLRNARQLGELRLAKLLKFTQDADRFAHGDFNTYS